MFAVLFFLQWPGKKHEIVNTAYYILLHSNIQKIGVIIFKEINIKFN